MNAVGVKAADWHHFLDLNHTNLTAGCGGQIEVTRGLTENQIAAFIRFPGLDD